MAAAEPKVRATAIRLSERFLRSPQAPQLFARLLELAESDKSAEVLRQLAFSLGQAAGADDERVLLALADHAASDA